MDFTRKLTLPIHRISAIDEKDPLMQNMKNTVLLLLNMTAILSLAYLLQFKQLNSFALIGLILVSVVVIPFLATHALKQYFGIRR